MRCAILVALAWAAALVASVVAEPGTGDRLSVAVSLGGGSLVREGGSYDNLQGDLRGPSGTIADRRWESVGYRAAYRGCLSLHVSAGYALWPSLAVLVSAELGWPRYDFEEYIRWSALEDGRPVSLDACDGSDDLKVKETSYFFAPTLGLRAHMKGEGEGPYVEVEWGRIFRHADLHWNHRLYHTGSPYSPRVRDRSGEALMRLALGNDFPLSEQLSFFLVVGFTSVKQRGLFFFEYAAGEQYVTFDGRAGLRWRF